VSLGLTDMPLKKIEGGLAVDGSSPFYLGIDQSYSGFAICAYYQEKYYIEVFKSDNRGIRRLMDIEDFVYEWMGHKNIIDAAMEGYAMGAKGKVFHLGELGGITKMALARHDIYPLIIPPTTLKKYVTGVGTGQKNQILLHTYKKWGQTFTDDNAADAYGLARLCSGDGKLAYEKAVYQQVQDPKYREI
jgi:Holliday junction resolvasome RuvABC endonuclease subunit